MKVRVGNVLSLFLFLLCVIILCVSISTDAWYVGEDFQFIRNHLPIVDIFLQVVLATDAGKVRQSYGLLKSQACLNHLCVDITYKQMSVSGSKGLWHKASI